MEIHMPFTPKLKLVPKGRPATVQEIAQLA